MEAEFQWIEPLEDLSGPAAAFLQLKPPSVVT